MGSIEKPENPPSYDEVVSQEANGSGAGSSSSFNSSSSYRRDSKSQRYQQQVPRPSQSSSSSHHSQLNTNDLYTANLDLPWRYPKNHFCKKCKNTGYKLKNGKACKDCWKQFAPALYYGHAALPTTPLKPPVHTGPRPNIVPLPPGSRLVPGPFIPGLVLPPPRVVRPGDPSIGGALCPKCHGRGLVPFFLDEETCRTCNGIGRVFM